MASPDAEGLKLIALGFRTMRDWREYFYSPVQKQVRALQELTPEERLKVFGHFCRTCGKEECSKRH